MTDMPIQREARVVVITGGIRGIGLAVARSLAAPGTTLVLVYRSDDAQAASAQAELEAAGATVAPMRADVADAAALAAGFDRLGLDRVDGLVHCAAIPNRGALLGQDMDEVRRAIEVGGLSLLGLAQLLVPRMSRGGSIVFLSGPAVERVNPLRGAIASGKAVGEVLVRYLAVECAERGITVNAVRPWGVRTALFETPLPDGTVPRLSPTLDGTELQAADVAGVVSFLLSPAASMIRGQTIAVDGGMSLVMPG